MKNTNFTQLDTDQIVKRKFDEQNDADRVYLVGGANLELSIDSDKIAKAVKEGLNSITIPQGQTCGEVQIINVPTKENVFIPQIEIKTIEVPVIIKETEYKTIEIPVITEKIVYVDRPIIVKEVQVVEVIREKYYPLVMKISAAIQALCVIGILLINLLKK